MFSKRFLFNLRNYSFLIVFLGLFFVGIFWLFQFTVPDRIENPSLTVGKVVGLKSANKGSSAEIEYEINGVAYSAHLTTSAHSNNVIGERYIVEYDPADPGERYVRQFEPVLDSTKQVKRSKGTIIRVYWFNHHEHLPTHAFEYQYTVNGKTIVRSQDLPPQYLEHHPHFKEGQQGTVMYEIQEPRLSIFEIPD